MSSTWVASASVPAGELGHEVHDRHGRERAEEQARGAVGGGACASVPTAGPARSVGNRDGGGQHRLVGRGDELVEQDHRARARLVAG